MVIPLRELPPVHPGRPGGNPPWRITTHAHGRLGGNPPQRITAHAHGRDQAVNPPQRITARTPEIGPDSISQVNSTIAEHQLWHHHFGHINPLRLKTLANQDLISDLSLPHIPTSSLPVMHGWQANSKSFSSICLSPIPPSTAHPLRPSWSSPTYG